MKYLILLIVIPLLYSCNFNIVGTKGDNGHSSSKEESLHYGVFMWEYEADKDSLCLNGKPFLLPIKEAFAEPCYHYHSKGDTVATWGQYQIVTVFEDSLVRIDSVEDIQIDGHIISITASNRNLDWKVYIFPKGELPPDTLNCYAFLVYYYRDSIGNLLFSNGDVYRDSLGHIYSHIDTLDSYKLIRKR